MRAFPNSPVRTWPSEPPVSVRNSLSADAPFEQSRPAPSVNQARRKSQGVRIRASHERNAVKRDILLLRNEMHSLRHGLRHEEMIEGITVMKRKSSKSDKMRIEE